MYDSVITQDDCNREQRRFLKSLGVRNMDELNKIFEECDFNIDAINQRLGVKE